MVSDPISEIKWRWNDVHSPCTDEDVAIAAEAPYALVAMMRFPIGIEEVTVTDDKIEHGIFVAVGLLWIATKYIVDGSPVVMTRWQLTVAIEGRFTARIRQAFDFESLCEFDHAEVGIAISAAAFDVFTKGVQPIAKPVLKVKFLVGRTDAPDHFALGNRLHASREDTNSDASSFMRRHSTILSETVWLEYDAAGSGEL